MGLNISGFFSDVSNFVETKVKPVVEDVASVLGVPVRQADGASFPLPPDPTFTPPFVDEQQTGGGANASTGLLERLKQSFSDLINRVGTTVGGAIGKPAAEAAKQELQPVIIAVGAGVVVLTILAIVLSRRGR